MQYLRILYSYLLSATIWISFAFTVLLFYVFLPFLMLITFLQRKSIANSLKYSFHLGSKIFIKVLQKTIPGLKIQIEDKQEILSLRSSILVCNHLSFIDPLLILSLFSNISTIVKGSYLNIPLFGRIIRLSGFIPSITDEQSLKLRMEREETLVDYLDQGGNLFVFPEGTRSRTGYIGSFNKGAFYWAYQCKAPIALLYIQNSNKTFPPNSFLFNTIDNHTLYLKLIDVLHPDYGKEGSSIKELQTRVYQIYKTEEQKLFNPNKNSIG